MVKFRDQLATQLQMIKKAQNKDCEESKVEVTPPTTNLEEDWVLVHGAAKSGQEKSWIFFLIMYLVCYSHRTDELYLDLWKMMLVVLDFKRNIHAVIISQTNKKYGALHKSNDLW